MAEVSEVKKLTQEHREQLAKDNGLDPSEYTDSDQLSEALAPKLTDEEVRGYVSAQAGGAVKPEELAEDVPEDDSDEDDTPSK